MFFLQHGYPCFFGLYDSISNSGESMYLIFIIIGAHSSPGSVGTLWRRQTLGLQRDVRHFLFSVRRQVESLGCMQSHIIRLIKLQFACWNLLFSVSSECSRRLNSSRHLRLASSLVILAPSGRDFYGYYRFWACNYHCSCRFYHPFDAYLRVEARLDMVLLSSFHIFRQNYDDQLGW